MEGLFLPIKNLHFVIEIIKWDFPMNQYGSNQLSFRTTSLFAKLLIDLFLFRRNASLYEFISCHFSTFSGVASGKVSKKLRIGIRHLLLWLPNF